MIALQVVERESAEAAQRRRDLRSDIATLLDHLKASAHELAPMRMVLLRDLFDEDTLSEVKKVLVSATAQAEEVRSLVIRAANTMAST